MSIKAADKSRLAQLILTCDDRELVVSIDALVSRNIIHVPPSEVRRAKSSWSGAREARCELSSLGMRSREPSPIQEMCKIIWTVYEDEDRLSDLAWKTARRNVAATPGHILEYLSTKGPLEAVRELVIDNKRITEQLCSDLFIDLGLTPIDAYFADKLLWKLGFDVARFGTSYQSVDRHLSILKKCLLSVTEPLSGSDRESIRSAGVNLFVELEYYLETLISFNVWMLSKDHFTNRFEYEPQDALSVVAETLPVSAFCAWDPKGGNTLGVLLEYLAMSVAWLEALPRIPEPLWKRSAENYPHYADKDEKFFPFHNIPFWANCDTDELASYVNGYREIASLFLKSGIAEIRNGLDHYRTTLSFPTLDSMLACESRIRQAVESADIKRFIPKRWWLRTRETNEFTQYAETFSDERGTRFAANYPAVLLGLREASFGDSVVIPHGNLLGNTNATVILFARDASNYSRMWHNYPAKLPLIRHAGGSEVEDFEVAVELE